MVLVGSLNWTSLNQTFRRPAGEVTPGEHKSSLGSTKKVLGQIPGAASLITYPMPGL